MEMDYRGFRPKPEMQKDGNGRLAGQIYVFEDTSPKFVVELVRLVYQFKQKYAQ